MSITAEPLEARALRNSVKALVRFNPLKNAEKLKILVQIGQELSAGDPDALFEEAKLDSLGAESELRDAQGGGLPSEEFASRLGLKSAETVRKYRLNGDVFAWEKDQRNLRYPAWQVHRGRLLPGLKEVLAVLRGKDFPPLSVISFFVYPSEELGNTSPLELLRGNSVEEVVEFAKRYGDIGA